MITLSQLRLVGKRKNLRNLDQMLQDYILEKIMYILGVIWFDRVVLKGGTALCKFYGVPRFSKDIDIEFESKSPQDTLVLFESIKEHLRKEGFGVSDIGKPGGKKPWVFHSLSIFVPSMNLYGGALIEVKTVKKLPPHEDLEYDSMYPDILPHSIKVASIEYILEEKVRAIMDLSRYQVRDLFDVYYIVRRFGLRISDILGEKFNEFCKIARSMLRYWNELVDIVLVGLPEPEKVMETIGCT